MDSNNILWWILIGLVGGVIGKLIMPGRDPGGFIVTILLGIAGALLAGFIGQAIGWYQNWREGQFLAAIVGTILILIVYRLVMRNRTRVP